MKYVLGITIEALIVTILYFVFYFLLLYGGVQYQLLSGTALFCAAFVGMFPMVAILGAWGL